MDYKELDQLIHKYEAGKTSLEEEKLLGLWLKQPQLPVKYRPLALQFLFFQTAQKEKMRTDPMARVNQQKQNKRHLWTHRLAMAASIILLMGMVFLFPKHKVPQAPQTAENVIILDSKEDARLAYEETQKALALVAEKLNTGTGQLEKLNTFKKAHDLVTSKTQKK